MRSEVIQTEAWASGAGAAGVASWYGIFEKSGFIALFLHPQAGLPLGERLNSVALNVDESLHSRGFQGLDLVLGIACYQHGNRNLGTDFAGQVQVLGVGTAEHDQVGPGACEF